MYFVSQYPNDVPDDVLGQLGSRVQHALRAFTPRDQKAVKVAAQTFRQNPAIDTVRAITELGVGEALVSTLDEKGRPTPVDWCLMAPPRSSIGPLSADERAKVFGRSPLRGRYDAAVDRESAYELLSAREKELEQRRRQAQEEAARQKPKSRGSSRQSAGEAFVKSVVRTFGTQIGRSLARGILGALRGTR